VPYRRQQSGIRSALQNAATIARTSARLRPDVIHSFGRLLSLLPLLPTRVAKVMSYQRAVTPRSVVWSRRLARGRLTFVGCSSRMLDGVRDLAPWRVVYNAVNSSSYTYAAEVRADAPLVFLGRVEYIKGPQVAIEVARRTGRRLVIAGNVPDGHQQFFEQTIAPHLGGRISHVGPVDDHDKDRLLAQAAALLMPILWEEPFGIVMAEALACGTPVIGFNRGAVPEIVRPGVTGFVCEREADMVAAVANLGTLSRRACRQDAEARFSQSALVDAYEAVYREAIATARGEAPATARRAGSASATAGSE
jgi:glycosyltransferase involved in cell wall biosynthesis